MPVLLNFVVGGSWVGSVVIFWSLNHNPHLVFLHYVSLFELGVEVLGKVVHSIE